MKKYIILYLIKENKDFDFFVPLQKCWGKRYLLKIFYFILSVNLINGIVYLIVIIRTVYNIFNN